MIWFCYFSKKIILFWAWFIVTPFLRKLGPKMVIFRGFTKFFTELLDYIHSY